MSVKFLGVAMVAMLAASAAQADTVLNTDLGSVNAPGTTTTDANGTTSTNALASPRATETPVLNRWYQTNLGGGATVGITNTYQRDGNGSAYFAQANNSSKADLQYIFASSANNYADAVLLSSVSAVSYDWFRDVSSTTGANFSPVLRLDIRKVSSPGVYTFAGSLVLEHVYQNQTPSPEGSWQTQSATLNSGIFWATSTQLGPNFAAANGGQKTLQAWIDANSTADLYVTGMSIGIGSGWNLDPNPDGSPGTGPNVFTGAADNVSFTYAPVTARGTVSLDTNFEVAGGAGAVPEPSTWAMLMLGFGAVGFAARRRRTLAAA